MESCWCLKKNSIVNWINRGVDFSPALTPCLKSACSLWKDGACIHIRKAGKPGRPQVFSREGHIARSRLLRTGPAGTPFYAWHIHKNLFYRVGKPDSFFSRASESPDFYGTSGIMGNRILTAILKGFSTGCARTKKKDLHGYRCGTSLPGSLC